MKDKYVAKIIAVDYGYSLDEYNEKFLKEKMIGSVFYVVGSLNDGTDYELSSNITDGHRIFYNPFPYKKECCILIRYEEYINQIIKETDF